VKGRYEIRLTGSGGQGLITAGIILAEAAILDGLNVVQTQSYGPEARGGASKAEVIIASDEIDYPKVATPDVVLAMTQEACNKYAGALKVDGLLIVDSALVAEVPEVSGRVYRIPITALARDRVGKPITANIVALGALTAITGVVSDESLRRAVARRVPRGTERLNDIALSVGIEAVTQKQLGSAGKLGGQRERGKG